MSDAHIQKISLSDTSAFAGEFVALFDAAGSQHNATDPDGVMRRPEKPEGDYARGLSDGAKAAEERFAEEREALTKLVVHAESMRPQASEELAQLIGTTVAALVGQIVGDFEPDADWLQSKIRKASDLISDCDKAQKIWMHPDDIALLSADTVEYDLCADPAAERGSIRIACSDGWVEDSNSLYLEKLSEELGLKGGAI